MKDVENKAEKAVLKGKEIPNLSPFNWEDPFLLKINSMTKKKY